MKCLLLSAVIVLGGASIASAQYTFGVAPMGVPAYPAYPVYAMPAMPAPVTYYQSPGMSFVTAPGYVGYQTPGYSFQSYSPYAAAAQYRAIYGVPYSYGQPYVAPRQVRYYGR